MSNYEPCGLLAADFARIAGSVQEAPVRLRFLKPAANALPDTDTIVIDKIDDGTHHPAPSTVITDYEKIIVDDHAGRDRTIILHSVALNAATAVVSVIDHRTGEVDAINNVTSAGWSANYYFAVKRDMDFNPETNELAIMVKRNVGGAAAALFVINLQKYTGELSTCNTLAENPDYRNCTIMEHTGAVMNYTMRFVRHYKNRWYCWIGDVTDGSKGRADFGYFNADGDWNSIWMQHLSIPSTIAPSFKGPSPLGVEGSGSYGDPMCVLAAPKTMEIDADGMLTLGMFPSYNTPYFGNEAMIVRIDLATLANMANDTAGIIDTVNLSYTFSGSIGIGVKDSETITITAAQADVDRIDQAGIYEIIMTFAAGGTGTAAPGFGVREYVTTNVGTVNCTGASQRFFVYSSDGVITFGIAAYYAFSISEGDGQKSVSATFKIRKFPNSLVECLGVHSETPIIATGDTDLPAVGDPEFVGGPARALVVDSAGLTTTPTDCHYSAATGTYAFSMDSGGGVHQGLMQIRAGGTNFTHFLSTNSNLYHNFVRSVRPIGSDTFLVASGFVNPNWNNVVQIFNAALNTLTAVADSFVMTYVGGTTHAAVDTGYSPVRSSVWIATENEIWIFRPATLSGLWSRDIRVWWDGSAPDKDYYVSGDSLDITDFQFSDERGLASASCTFTAHGADFLPWKKSTANEDLNNPGAYSPLLTYGTRVLIQRGIRQAGGGWNWIDEAQVVVTELPENLERGIVTIPVQCCGIAAHIFTKAKYEFFHEPTRTHASWVTLYEITAYDPNPPADFHATKDFGYYPDYVDPTNPGARQGDITTMPDEQVKLDGADTTAYQIDSRRGIFRFAADQTGAVVTADFWFYVAGTNEVEDIIECICTHPNDVDAAMLGAGLDEGYITDNRTDDPLTPVVDLLGLVMSATFPRDNLYSAGDVAIKRDGAVWAASNYTLNLRTGIATFAIDQTGHTFTSTYKHKTLQASGITAPLMQFTEQDDGTALDCIERASQATISFNYIFKARRDGKFESDYYIQKETADITITDAHIILEKLIRDPADEDCYTDVISFGRYPEAERPNLALGVVPINLWPYSWGHTVTMEAITDGDVNTQQSGGWGGNDGFGPIRAALIAAAPDGIPVFSIDLGELVEVDQIVFVRGSGRSNEGGYSAVQTQSIWASTDGSGWEQLIPAFETPPALTVNFKVEQDWPKGRKYQYFRVNLHDIGLYLWEHIDSQISFAEFQVYESEYIRGYAQLQDADAAAALWDYNGLMEKHGLLTLTARDGQPDETLVTQEMADADAASILTEVSRYVVTHNLTACPLPGVDILCTINITNTILNTSLNFFIENRSFGDYLDRDSIDGVFVP